MTKPEYAQLEIFRKEAGNESLAFDLWTRWKILTDLYFFGAKVLGWEDAKKGRRKRVDPTLHRWLARILQGSMDKMVLIPRLHLKTTWVKLRIAQLILGNPNVRILLASTTTNLVADELNDIVRMLMNPTVMRLFPNVVPSPGKRYSNWEKKTEDELTIRRDPEIGKPPQEPQIRAVGMETRITGQHFDYGFLDDIIDRNTVTTPEQMRKVEDWWGYYQSIIELDAETCITGTFYHPNDLYHKIWNERQVPNIYIRKAIENGKPLYKSWFTLKDLDKIKKRQGTQIFNSQYMLDPYPDEEKMFPPPQPTFVELPPGDYRYYIAVDPAATTNAWSDESGVVVGAVNKYNQLFIVEAIGVKMKGGELIDLVINFHLKYRPIRVGIELGLQEHLTSIISMKVADWEAAHGRKLGLNIMPIPISRRKSKAERVNRSLAAAVREGKVLISQKCRDLLREMEFFTGHGNEKDNLVDAASMIFSTSEAFAQHYWIDRQFRKSGPTLEELFHPHVKGWEAQFVH